MSGRIKMSRLGRCAEMVNDYSTDKNLALKLQEEGVRNAVMYIMIGILYQKINFNIGQIGPK